VPPSTKLPNPRPASVVTLTRAALTLRTAASISVVFENLGTPHATAARELLLELIKDDALHLIHDDTVKGDEPVDIVVNTGRVKLDPADITRALLGNEDKFE